MGNYLFHFDDGSDALMHYGKKGMHWGEWNEETRERYLNEGKLPDFPVPSGIGGKFGKSITETDVPGGVYSRGSDGEYYLDKEATEKQWHANKKREFAEKTNQDYDPGTGGVYSKTASGSFARAIDNLMADPGGTLSRVARDTVSNGKNLVDGVLGALKNAKNNLEKEAGYLTKGFTPRVEADDAEAVKKWRRKGYTKVRTNSYGENLGGSYGVSRNGRFVEDPESVKKRHRRARKKTNAEYRDYQNSAARRVRNLFGYK